MALAPTVSHALAAQRGEAPWSILCTPDGLRLTAPGVIRGEESPAGATGVLEHCPYCSSTSFAALPPTAGMSMQLAVAHDTTPLLFLSAPCTLHAWRCAQPRAPPLSI